MSEMDNVDLVQDKNAETEGAADDDQKPVFNKIQVHDVVTREKQKAYERGKREVLEQMQQQQQPDQAAPQAQQQAQPQSMGGIQQVSPDEIRRMISEETPRALQAHVHQAGIQRTTESFVQKMRAAESKHPGLEKKLNELDWTHLGPLIEMVNDMDNPGDIMKEIVENPMKLGSLMSLSHSQKPLARQSLYDLSNSIKQNEAAKAQEATTSDPLSPIKPSHVGADGGSKGSVRDFKNRYRG